METRHRDAIQAAYPILVQHCNIDLLLPVLVQKNVFSSEMIMKYEHSADNHLKRKRKLFLDIQMRGPKAFSNLVTSLHETGQNYLADILEPINTNGSAPPRRHAIPFVLPVDEDPQQLQEIGNNNPGNAQINLRSEPVHINVKPSTKLHDDPIENVVPVYSTHSRNRGVVLIINIINYINDVHPRRKGAEVDSRNLTELFLQMGFQVEEHVDVTGSQMESIIHNFKSSSKIKGVDIVFIIIMGHGTHEAEITNIAGTDNKAISTKWVEEQFDNAHCKALQRRPKIFMYQTCRGLSGDFGVAKHIEIDSAANIPLRTRSDMLIAYSTLPGNVSHRDIYLGTWYISLFCEIMMNHAQDMHLEDIFKMVDDRLLHLRSASQTMQTSMYTNIGFKTCYVHPKVYMGDDGVIRDIQSDQ